MNLLNPAYELLEKYYSEMEEKLLELLSIPSTPGEAAPGAPFGPGPDQALRYCLELAGQLGFVTSNIKGYVGIVDLPGETGQQIGILSHVDVVEAVAKDWKHHPFHPVIDEGFIYGRGALDDKGPLVACLYAMLALKEVGCVMKRTVRHLLGTNEETGMGCMKYFIKNYPQMPAFGFVPDACFPVVIGEKGLARWTFSSHWDAVAGGDIQLIKITGGTGINTVPPIASASFTANKSGQDVINTAYGALPSGLRETIKLDMDGETVSIIATGVAAHAALPEKGDNAISKLLAFITTLPFVPEGAYDFINDVAAMLADWKDGRTLGIDDRDQYSALTNLFSLMEVLPKGGSFSCDTRYPVTREAAGLKAKLKQIAASHQMDMTWWYQMDQTLVSEQTPLVQKLVQVFQKETGDMAPAQVIGSGTYARLLPGFVAYGPLFPEDENITHQANERICRKKLLRLTKIYAAAIYELANL